MAASVRSAPDLLGQSVNLFQCKQFGLRFRKLILQAIHVVLRVIAKLAHDDQTMIKCLSKCSPFKHPLPRFRKAPF